VILVNSCLNLKNLEAV